MDNLDQRFAAWSRRIAPPKNESKPRRQHYSPHLPDVEEQVRRDLQRMGYRVYVRHGIVRFRHPISPDTLIWLIDNIPNLDLFTIKIRPIL